MPIYEFHCQKCGRDFEELVRGRTPKVVCPHCGGRKCRKLMSASRFFSKSAAGTTVKSSAGSGCAGCAGGSACATCDH
jgi:putative FmdB family regulatory protein